MKSQEESAALTFTALQARMLDLVKTKIQNGEFSERYLAKLLGVSQSHLHNVLKGVRQLHVSLADKFCMQLHITAADLLTRAELLNRVRALDTDDSVPPRLLLKWEQTMLPGFNGTAATSGRSLRELRKLPLNARRRLRPAEAV